MSALARSATDDRSRHPVSGPDGTELWHFDWVGAPVDAGPGSNATATGSTVPAHAGFVRFAVQPGRRRTQFWAGVLRPDRPYVLCRDGELQLPPQPRVLEVRGGALWTHAICETSLEHWTVAMEAYALAFDDPDDAVGSELGDRIGLAFDLEWERPIGATPAALSAPTTTLDGFELSCTVHGELIVGDDTIAVDALGRRVRAWGTWDGAPTPGPVASPDSSSWRAPFLVEHAPGHRHRCGLSLQHDRGTWHWVG